MKWALASHHSDNPKEMFRQHYFDCLDLVVSCIKRSRLYQRIYYFFVKSLHIWNLPP